MAWIYVALILLFLVGLIAVAMTADKDDLNK